MDASNALDLRDKERCAKRRGVPYLFTLNKLASACLAFLMCPTSMFAQCPPHWVHIDSVFHLLEKQTLQEARELYVSLDPQTVDPRSKVSLCLEAYAKGDTTWFKTLLRDLVTNHGFRMDDQTSGYLFANDLLNGRYREWYTSIETNGIRDFENTHAQRRAVIDSLKVIHKVDQSRKDVYASMHDEAAADSIVMLNDSHNFNRLLGVCATYGLPNGFDDVYNASGIVEFVLLHCAKNPSGFQDRWDAIMPYIDEAFRAGKGENAFAYYYDMTLHYHTGMQYYGTLPSDVPIKDQDGLADRRAKYCLR